MGSWDQTSHRKIHLKMKFSAVALAVILAVLISSCEGQKGGAKSAMRNRGRGGGGRGRSSMSRSHVDNGSRGPDDMFGNGNGRKACVGLCYLRKLKGKPPMPERETGRKICVGLCYLKKIRALRADKKG